MSRFVGVKGCTDRRVDDGVVMYVGCLADGEVKEERVGEGMREGGGAFSLLLEVCERERRRGYLIGEVGLWGECLEGLGGRGGGDLNWSGAENDDISGIEVSQVSIEDLCTFSCAELAIGITRGTP